MPENNGEKNSTESRMQYFKTYKAYLHLRGNLPVIYYRTTYSWAELEGKSTGMHLARGPGGYSHIWPIQGYAAQKGINAIS